MPEEIILADGTKREVPTEEELKDLQEKAKGSEETSKYIHKLKEDLGVEEGASLTERITELKDSENPNWRELRTQNKTLKKTLKEKGIEVDDNNQVTKKPEGVSQEDAQKIAEETTRKTLEKTKRDEALSKFTDEEKKQVEPLLDKAMALGGSLEENLDLVEKKLFPGRQPDPVHQNFYSRGGGAPRQANSGEQLNETTKEIAGDLGIKQDSLEKGGAITSAEDL